MTDQFLTDRDLAARLGVHRTTPWRWAAGGDFPQPIRLAPNCSRWRESDIEAWLAERAAAAGAE
ncbi:helix-turn-helix transcriptional regulator [Thiohalospira halophila]|uniref:helix-turn-helix transcriptional regulator n=1 Tax=Thiohalospira halophila TaxID=381300 RepID=UPI000B8A21C7|nr:AlpA family phage regulatory protein [Thiohalospira halophila]